VVEVTLASASGTCFSTPSAAWSGSEYGVAWRAHTVVGTYAELRFARISAAGAQIGASVPVSPSAGAPHAMTWNGSEYGLFATPGIQLFRLAADGSVLGTTSVSASTPTEINVTWNGSEYLVAWVSSNTLRVMRVSRLGAALAP